jgi:DNA-binding NtrC family response regulator
MATVLLVDDDPLQASVRKSILERKFSDVRRVGDAADALCLVEQPQFAKNLGLVVSGNQRSGIGVSDFVAELHARLPGLPVLVLGVNLNHGSVAEDTDVCFLPRPIPADELLAAASRMIASSERKSA